MDSSLIQCFQEPSLLPDVLKDYAEVLPGAAERILVMVKLQAAHRHRIESRGQIFGFSILAGFIAAGMTALIEFFS